MITGRPQNMLIGLSSRIPHVTFTAHLAPIALAGLAVAWAVLGLVYRVEFAAAAFAERAALPAGHYRPLRRRSLLATALVLVALRWARPSHWPAVAGRAHFDGHAGAGGAVAERGMKAG